MEGSPDHNAHRYLIWWLDNALWCQTRNARTITNSSNNHGLVSGDYYRSTYSKRSIGTSRYGRSAHATGEIFHKQCAWTLWFGCWIRGTCPRRPHFRTLWGCHHSPSLCSYFTMLPSSDSYTSIIKIRQWCIVTIVTKTSRNFPTQHHTFLWLYMASRSPMSVVIVTSAPFSVSFVWTDTSLLKGVGVFGG